MPDTGPAAAPSSEPLVCSARGCRDSAVWALRWNNPKLHTPERRKTWLACAAHRTTLSDFLSLRGFLRDVVPVEELVPEPASGPGGPGGQGGQGGVS